MLFRIFLCVALVSLVSCRRPADQAAENSPSPKTRVSDLFETVADGSEAEATRAIMDLFRLCKEGEGDYDYWNPKNTGEKGRYYAAASHLAFYPSYRGYQSRVIQSRSGTELARRAVPRMIALMQGELADKVDYLLRLLQGRSPSGKDAAAWQAWWSTEGQRLLDVPAQAGIAVEVVE